MLQDYPVKKFCVGAMLGEKFWWLAQMGKW